MLRFRCTHLISVFPLLWKMWSQQWDTIHMLSWLQYPKSTSAKGGVLFPCDCTYLSLVYWCWQVCVFLLCLICFYVFIMFLIVCVNKFKVRPYSELICSFAGFTSVIPLYAYILLYWQDKKSVTIKSTLLIGVPVAKDLYVG